MKKILLLLIIIVLGIFIYLKIQIMGNPNSSFNQTTRFVLGKHPTVRTVLGLHSAGDARAEILQGSGPISIEWFKPESDEIDNSILQSLSNEIAKYTGRQVNIVYGGGIDDGTVPLVNLNSFVAKASLQRPSSGTVLTVFFTEDYSPRPDNELSTTYGESGMALSLTAHRNFLQLYSNDVTAYLTASALHEFGNQIGMKETSTPPIDPECIMNLHAGINGHPLEVDALAEPQDFCPAEQQEINNIKASLQ